MKLSFNVTLNVNVPGSYTLIKLTEKATVRLWTTP